MSESRWFSVWGGVLGVEPTLSLIVAAILLLGMMFLIVLPGAALMSYFERKISADFQARVGPNRAGAAGILQPIADFLKLIQKEPGPLSFAQKLGLGFLYTVLFASLAALPLGSGLVLIDTDLSAFIPVVIALVMAFGAINFSLSRPELVHSLAGFRLGAQCLSGCFPALIAIICVGTKTGSYHWGRIVELQSAFPLHWIVFASPFHALSFVVFMIAGMVLLALPPFDAPFSSVDLAGGLAAGISGYQVILFKVSRFYSFFLWCLVSATLFLGGWRLPEMVVQYFSDREALFLIQLLELFLLLFKTFCLMVLALWITRANPRVRSAQITNFSWRILSPVALFSLAGAVLWAMGVGTA